MAALFSYGLLTVISIAIGLIFTIIGVFIGHIILFDSIFLAAISGPGLCNGNLMCVNHCCGRCVCVSKFICCGDQINTIGNHCGSGGVPKCVGGGYGAVHCPG